MIILFCIQCGSDPTGYNSKSEFSKMDVWKGFALRKIALGKPNNYH